MSYIAKERIIMWIDISQPLYNGMKVWPGDVAFEQKSTSKISEGESVNTSSITMSTHTGTHLDAPYHYDETGDKINDIDVNQISGEAQIVSLTDVHFIEESHIRKLLPLKASIILFKTTEGIHDYYSYPAFSPEAVRLLAKNGVTLIGTDGPSVDPLTSQELPAHIVCRELNIFILEGLRLLQPEGIYELMALPLLIEEADGSPVRAVIKRQEGKE